MMIGAKKRHTRTPRHGLRRGGRAPSSLIETSELGALEDRIYMTYRSRLRSANRIRLRGQLWNLPLVTSPLVTIVVALVSLLAPRAYAPSTEALLLVLSILTLVVSIIVPTANYAVSAERLFVAYRTFQRLASKIEREKGMPRTMREARKLALRIDAEYQETLDATGNHSAADYWGVVSERNRKYRGEPEGAAKVVPVPFGARIQIWASWLLTALPVIVTLALIPLIFPALGWFLAH